MSNAPTWRLVPEVVQTSEMDCGPAALKCLLEGFGIPVSYGRLREACQTDVDGTSINVIEDVANLLGLEAEQMMVPIDHLLRPETGALPAIVVLRMPNGLAHFVVVWGVYGSLVQVMDPATGRRWPTRDRLLTEVYAHSTTVPAAVWHEWACSDDFVRPLSSRLRRLGVPEAGAAYVKPAMCAPGWREIALLDAATRLVESMVRAKSIRAGLQATRLLEHLIERCRAVEPGTDEIVTSPYWTVLSAPASPDGEEMVHLRGAVLIRMSRPRSGASPTSPQGERLSPELRAALAEVPPRPEREFLKLMREDGLLAPLALVMALTVVAFGSGVEALLFRSLFELGARLGLVKQRLGAMGLFALFLMAISTTEALAAAGLFQLGRHLDTRLRLAFLRKIPQLGDRYFQSRPISDMAERGHSLYMLHLLLRLGGQLVRFVLEAIVVMVGIAWLHPHGVRLAVFAGAAIVVIPLVSQPMLAERDLRVRVHSGSLGRFYLDALLGLVTVKAHGAERTVRREHEGLLVEWGWAGRLLYRAVLFCEGTQSLLAFVIVIWLVSDYVASMGEGSGVLLLAFWALRLVMVGQELALLARQYTSFRNIALRLLEPLGAIGESLPGSSDTTGSGARNRVSAAASGGGVAGMALELRGVRVVASGHVVLDEINFVVAPGEHVAIVGASGAGKSSLVGLFLGWHRPSAGVALVDGEPLDDGRLDRVRRETAWVDPGIHLWNRTLLENLHYGHASASPNETSRILEDTDLFSVLENLPAGLQTVLGEGGGLVSGGEGQRIRFGRGLLQSKSRLVIFDEAFRGLDRQKRRELLTRARGRWSNTTLLCITHDIGDTTDFKRVIVMDGGRVVEDGVPAELMVRSGSHYRALLEDEDQVRTQLWPDAGWRRLRVERGSAVNS